MLVLEDPTKLLCDVEEGCFSIYVGVDGFEEN